MFKTILHIAVFSMISLHQQAVALSLGDGIYVCPQEMHPEYNFSRGVQCDNPQLLVSTSDTYETFNSKICNVLFNHSASVKFINVKGYSYKPRMRAANAAYMMLKWALLQLAPSEEGMWLEFGVAAGYSINVTALLRKTNGHTYGFDTFEGLPDLSGHWTIGMYTQNGTVPLLHPNAVVIKGLFNETLQPFLDEHKGEKLSFVNMDMDQYSGALYVLTRLLPAYTRPGSVLHFHDFLDINEATLEMRGGEEMLALYDTMKSSAAKGVPIRLQLMPFRANFRFPVVFRVL
jgi:hypothetical protein